MEERELTARQRRFVEEYLAGGDAAEAALAAGYAPGTAAAQGARLLRDPRVQAYRREREQRLYDALGVSPAWIGRRLVEIAERCMQAVPHLSRNPETKQREPDGVWEFDPTGALRALHELSEHLRSLAPEEDETAPAALSFEDWLEAQDRESRL